MRSGNSAVQEHSDCEFVFPSRHCWEERMTSWRKDNQPHLTASKLCEANHTGVRLAHVSMGSDTGPGQPVTHKMLTFPTLFSLFPSLLRNYSSLKYVCTVCICMYVCTKTLLSDLNISTRKDEPYLTVCYSHHFASWVWWDKVSLFEVYSLWEHGDACLRTTATAPTCWHSRLGDA